MTMNKKQLYISVILASLALLSANAQIGERRNEFRVGVTSGVSMNSIDFDPTIKQGKLMGLNGGVAMKYICEKYFKTLCALQVEVNYAKLGWKEDIMSYSGQKLPDTYQREMNYIQVPMFANLGWGKEEKGLLFYFLAGPQVGFCFSDASKKSSTWTVNEEGNPDRPNNMYAQYDMKIDHKFDYGIAAGFGLELNTAKLGHLTLEGRYYYGLGDVFGNSKKDVFSRSANTTIVVKLGYYVTVLKN